LSQGAVFSDGKARAATSGKELNECPNLEPGGPESDLVTEEQLI
jgi:hypothetical protein